MIANLFGKKGFLGSHLAKRVDQSDRSALIINAAGRVRGIGGNRREPASMITENLRAAISVFDYALANGAERIVNFGSVCAYSPESPVPFCPEDYLKGAPEPTNGAYAMAKRAIFEMSRAYAREYGMDNLYLVMPNLYGPGDRFGGDGHVIPDMIRKVDDAVAANDTFVTFWGTGNAEREFLYVEDAAELILMAIQSVHETARPVHLTGGEIFHVSELAQLVCRVMGFKGEILWDASKPDGQMRRKLKDGFVHPNPTSMLRGIEKTVQWYEEMKAKDR